MVDNATEQLAASEQAEYERDLRIFNIYWFSKRALNIGKNGNIFYQINSSALLKTLAEIFSPSSQTQSGSNTTARKRFATAPSRSPSLEQQQLEKKASKRQPLTRSLSDLPSSSLPPSSPNLFTRAPLEKPQQQRKETESPTETTQQQLQEDKGIIFS